MSRGLWSKPKLCAFPLHVLFIHSFVHFLVYVYIHSYGSFIVYCFLFATPGTEQGVHGGEPKGSDPDSCSLQLSGVSVWPYVLVYLIATSCFLICKQGYKLAWPFSYDEMRINVHEILFQGKNLIRMLSFGRLTETSWWQLGQLTVPWLLGSSLVWYKEPGFQRPTSDFHFRHHHILAKSPWATYITSLGLNLCISRKTHLMPALQSIFVDPRGFVNQLTQLSLE